MNLREFGIVENKLRLQTQEGKHHFAWFVHNGVTVARTMRSHGNNKFIPEHKIRKQLHLTADQLAELIGCHIQLDGYLKILADKGLIAKPESQTPAEAAS
jgi:hypothetical protein